MMNSFKSLLFLTAILSLSIFSCKQTEPDPVAEETFDPTIISEIVRTQDAFSDVFHVADKSMNDSGIKKTSDFCADIDLNLLDRTLLIDFGTGCTGIDGRTRSGSIFIEYQGNFWEPGANYIYTLTDYTVDGVEVDGIVTLTGFDRDSQNRLFMGFSVAGGEINYPDGSFVTYETERTYTWIAGEGTGTLEDNVYEVTGFADGQSSNGQGYVAEILTGLEYKAECFDQHIFYPASGELEVQINNDPSPYLIDYGSGICDKDILVNYNGQDSTITLP